MHQFVSWDGWICVAMAGLFIAYVLFRTLLDTVKDFMMARGDRIEKKVDRLLENAPPQVRVVPSEIQKAKRRYDANVVHVDFKSKKRRAKKGGSDDSGPSAA